MGEQKEQMVSDEQVLETAIAEKWELRKKNMVTTILLTFLTGPLGLMYVSVVAAAFWIAFFAIATPFWYQSSMMAAMSVAKDPEAARSIIVGASITYLVAIWVTSIGTGIYLTKKKNAEMELEKEIEVMKTRLKV